MKTYKSIYGNWVFILTCMIGFSQESVAKQDTGSPVLNKGVEFAHYQMTTVFDLNERQERLNAPLPPPPGDCSDLFITEYIEGSSNNKAIEIYNPTSDPIDLSNYSIKKYSNGSGSSVTTYSSWSGTIPGHGTIVVRNNNAALSAITSAADFTTTSGVFTYNGNDPVALFNGGDMIDIVGSIGSSANFAKDRTLVRKSSIAQGVTTYDASEWDVYSQNFTDSLGGHHSSACAVVAVPTCDTDTLLSYTGCNQVVLDDSTYLTSTTLTDTVLNAANCDSIITTEITVNPSYNSVESEISGFDSVVVNGTAYFTTQTLNLSLTSIYGCDSLVEVPVRIVSTADLDTLGFQSFELEGDSWAYTLNQTTYNSNNDIWDDLTSVSSVNPTEGDYLWAMRDLENGISAVNLHTMSFDPISVSGYTNISFSFDYYSNLFGGSDFVDYIVEFDNGNTWGSSTSLNNDSEAWITESIDVPNGTQYVRLQLRGDFNGGSDYAAFDNVLIYGIPSPNTCQPVDTTLDISSCESYTYTDSTYTVSTQILDTLTQAGNSCDSIVTLNLTINQPVLSTDIQVACESYTWIDGVTYTSSNNIAKDTLVAANGCDSIITLDLTINQPVTSTDVQVACDSYTWINGETYTSSNNTAKDTLVAVNGCDSIITLDLTINESVTSTDVQVACDSYTWINGETYTSSNNTAKDTLVAVNGCDSIVTLDLTINESVTSTDVQVACDSYTWINGETYTSSNNTAKDTLVAANGCDSIITLDLTINQTVTSTDVQVACDSYTWINGVTYTSTNNTAKDTLTTVNGCDSIITLDLTINESVTSTDVQVACDSYTWINGETYTSSNNTVKDTLLAANGCDSIITLDLTINESVSSTDIQVACDSYTWINGETYTSSNNTAKDTLVAANGCDSIITLDLTINQTVSAVDVQMSCDAYTWINGVTYTESNSSAKDTLTTVNGCDSIVTLNLSIVGELSSTDVQTACETFTWINGETYTSSNSTAKDTLTSVSGCDSIITLDLTIYETQTGVDVQTACDSYTWINGEIYTSSNNTAKDTLTTVNGCDSIVTLDLTIYQTQTGVDVQTACDSYTWMNGVTYTASNSTAKDTLTTVDGCDSIVTLNLTINESATSTDVQVACDSYTWINGVTYTASNHTAKDTLATVNGCDSIVTLDLTINESVTNTDVQVACGSYTWINGVTYTESNNTAKDTLTTVNGCDSIIELDLTISDILVSVDEQTACETFTWINGETYTESNHTAVDTLTSSNGCDSIVTLNLTILNETYGTDVITDFGSHTWIDGVTYTDDNNTATHTLVNSAGCDSIVTLNLTVIREYCALYSTSSRIEWIKQVELGDDIDNSTGRESGGYGFYSTDTLVVDTNEVVNVALTPGYRRRAYKEYWRIWVDWNYDGDFNDAGEKVFEQAGKNVQTGSFTVPVNVSDSDLRVRVAMRWRRYPASCGRYRNGEVEDYVLRVNGAQGYPEIVGGVKMFAETYEEGEGYELSSLYPNPVSQGDVLSGYIRVEETGLKSLQIVNTLGQVIKSTSIDCQEEEERFEISTQGLEKGIYFIQIDQSTEALKLIVN